MGWDDGLSVLICNLQDFVQKNGKAGKKWGGPDVARLRSDRHLNAMFSWWLVYPADDIAYYHVNAVKTVIY